MILSLLVGPIWIDPLFNDFGPMKDKVLEAKILGLAERAGIEGSRVYEVNKSIDTKAVNAYVTGYDGTKRIVLRDTITAKLNEKELLFVMGHETGHYVLGHMRKGIALGSVLILITLYISYRLAGGLIARYGDRWGFDQLSDLASLPLIILLASLLSFLVSPLVLGYSSYQEYEADRFGLEITQANHSAATAFIKLQEENLSVPRPGLLYRLWRASHTPVGERIDFCNRYHPWKTGQPLKYAPLIHEPRRTIAACRGGSMLLRRSGLSLEWSGSTPKRYAQPLPSGPRTAGVWRRHRRLLR
jgi:Zn-dependent protease with chaperone function